MSEQRSTHRYETDWVARYRFGRRKRWQDCQIVDVSRNGAALELRGRRRRHAWPVERQHPSPDPVGAGCRKGHAFGCRRFVTRAETPGRWRARRRRVSRSSRRAVPAPRAPGRSRHQRLIAEAPELGVSSHVDRTRRRPRGVGRTPGGGRGRSLGRPGGAEQVALADLAAHAAEHGGTAPGSRCPRRPSTAAAPGPGSRWRRRSRCCPCGCRRPR